MMGIVNEKAAQKAVDALVQALGLPESEISRIEVNCSGSVKVFTRSRAYYQAAHVRPFASPNHTNGSET